MFVAHLVLDEHGVPAVFDQVGGIRPAQRVQIQSCRKLQIVVVAAEPAQQGVLGDQGPRSLGNKSVPFGMSMISAISLR